VPRIFVELTVGFWTLTDISSQNQQTEFIITIYVNVCIMTSSLAAFCDGSLTA